MFILLPLDRPNRRSGYKSIQHKPRTQPETGDKAIHGGVAIVGGPGIGEVQGAFLLLDGEMRGQPVLVFTDCLQLVLDTLIIFKAAVLRFVLP